MFLEPSFAEFGKEVVLFCHVTSQVEGRANDDLLQRKGGDAFPFIVAMDASGQVLAKHDGPREVDGFRGLMESGKAMRKTLTDLLAKAKGGDATAAADLLGHQLELGHLSLAEATKGLEALKDLPEDRRKSLGQSLLKLEVADIMAGVNQDKSTHVAAGKRFAAMLQSGREPEDRMSKLNAWFFTSVFAEEGKDAALFEKAYAVFKAEKGIRPDFIEEMGKRLEAMKKGGGETPAKEPAKDPGK